MTVDIDEILDIDEESMLEFVIMEELAHLHGGLDGKLAVLKEEERAKTKVRDSLKKKAENYERSGDMESALKYEKLLEFAEVELKTFAARYRASSGASLKGYAAGLFAKYLAKAKDEEDLEGEEAIKYALKETEEELEKESSELEEKADEADKEDSQDKDAEDQEDNSTEGDIEEVPAQEEALDEAA